MKLAYITSSFPYGPGEGFVIAEIEELRRSGHLVEIVPMWARGKQTHDANISELRGSRPLCSVRIFKCALLEAICFPVQALKALRLLLCCKSLASVARTLLLLPKSLWLARVCRQHQIEHVHAYWCSAPATIAIIASSFSRIPWSMSCHRSDIKRNDLLKEKLQSTAFARFISERAVTMAPQVSGVLEKKAVVLHVGVCVPKEVHSALKDVPTFLCPANMVLVKGHKYLLEAALLLKQQEQPFRLLLAGDGPLKTQLKAEASAAGLLNDVHFLGALPHGEILRIYTQNRIIAAVLPSLDLGHGEHEGIPVALMEAMSYGTPVISTRTGSIPELIAPGCGIMVPPGDFRILAREMQRLIDDPELCRRLGENGRRRISEHFNVKTISTQLQDLFNGQSPAVMKRHLQTSDIVSAVGDFAAHEEFRSSIYVHSSSV